MVLRKLAFKSILGFGKFQDMTVQQLISLGNRPYLVWCYYNQSHISFLDEVLDELFILPEMRIVKPGKDLFLFSLLEPSLKKKGLQSQSVVQTKMNKAAHILWRRTNHIQNSGVTRNKAQIQAINQGHGRYPFEA